MTDSQITQALATRSPLPSVYAIICEFRVGYQRARRCMAEVTLDQLLIADHMPSEIRQRIQATYDGKSPFATEELKRLTMEDF